MLIFLLIGILYYSMQLINVFGYTFSYNMQVVYERNIRPAKYLARGHEVVNPRA